MAKGNNYQQGLYNLRNPNKYKGDPSNVYARSSWERRFMIWADTHPHVLEWGSETVVVPYISPVDNRPHRYFVDFRIKVQNRHGDIKEYLIEIKPKCECLPPKQPKKQTSKAMANYWGAVETFAVNQAKWKYAKKYAEDRGSEFLVLNEEHLGIS